MSKFLETENVLTPGALEPLNFGLKRMLRQTELSEPDISYLMFWNTGSGG